MTAAQKFANEAVYTLQFNSADAIRYISRNAKVDDKTAMVAFAQAVEFSKSV